MILVACKLHVASVNHIEKGSSNPDSKLCTACDRNVLGPLSRISLHTITSFYRFLVIFIRDSFTVILPLPISGFIRSSTIPLQLDYHSYVHGIGRKTIVFFFLIYTTRSLKSFNKILYLVIANLHLIYKSFSAFFHTSPIPLPNYNSSTLFAFRMQHGIGSTCLSFW